MNVAQALAAAATLGVARMDAQLLLLHALGRRPDERGWLLAHDTDGIDNAHEAAFLMLCERRAMHEPVAYLVGHKEFHGLELRVDHRVLVPRPDTETLVDWALELLGCAPLAASRREGHGEIGAASPRIIDLGTGSGAIALALKHRCPEARIEAVDASADALAVAQANAQRLKLDIAFRQADWLAGAHAPYDLIVSNPPYVREDDEHLAALHSEPLAALASGPDGLADIRRIALQAPACLKAGGWLLLEHGWDQAPAVRALLQAAGLTGVESRRDLAGIERCSGGQRLEGG